MPNFYQLLSVEPTATSQEIKRAFRSEIARYHPDKVQHLGKEFQDMAASRAAALTEAYRILMNAELRAEYDRNHLGPAAVAAPATEPPPHKPPAPAEPPPAQPHSPSRGTADRSDVPPPRFASERKDRDDFVRRATLERFRKALSADGSHVEEHSARGFDLDFTMKTKKLFSRDDGQRVAAKVVAHVDTVAVQDVWNAAQKTATPICIFLMGSRVAPAEELANAIADLRRRSRGRTGISVIPIDVRDWSAHIPSDAPDACKNLLKRLQASIV